MMKSGVFILTIGDELLDGRSADRNSHWLLQELAALGAAALGVEVVGDAVEDIVAALRRAADRSDTVLATGGLGPTVDDRTREALAKFAAVPLVLDEEILATVRQRFQARGRSMPPGNERQAMRPQGSTAVTNPIGTAPGLILERDATLLAVMPGVPNEMRRMWREEIAPRLDRRLRGGRPPHLRLRLARSGESAIAAQVDAWLSDKPGLDVAYCVNDWGVDVLLRGLSADALTATGEQLARALAPRVYQLGDASLPELLLARLRTQGATLALAESCTGGLLAAALTDVPGSSEVFLGAVVAYGNRSKVELLGVEPAVLDRQGAVSEACALQMARGARRRFSADFALATTGIAGPAGGSVEKPVGSIWIAVADAQGEKSEFLRLSDDRETNRRLTVAAALDLLRLRLCDGRLEP